MFIRRLEEGAGDRMNADYEAVRKSMHEDFACFFSLGPIEYFTDGAKKFRALEVELKRGKIETQDTTKAS